MKMPMLLFVLWLLAWSALRADYLDEKGIRRVGKPPPGARYRDVNNPKGKLKTATEDLPEGSVAPAKFGGVPLRLIEGKIHDFSKAIEWANEWAYLRDMGPQPIVAGSNNVSSGGSSSDDSKFTKPKISDWEERSKANRAKEAEFKDILVTGKVLKTLPDGLLLAQGADGKVKILLKNYPKEKDVVEGDWIETLALKCGPYQYKTGTGPATTAIRSYDHGTPSP